MTSQLEGQRKELIDTNQQLDARRRFTETMLAGVSAGVVGLNGDGEITLINRAAARLLNATPDELEGRHYSEAVPELAGLIRRAMSENHGRAAGQADLKRTGVVRHLNVQVRSEAGEASHGFVVTFDDITDLVSAQRTAAWAEVARRIAHEIKNPLTPIQLSAERLKRKYAERGRPPIPKSSPSAPTPSSARWATSAAWSTSSRRSRACRRLSIEDRAGAGTGARRRLPAARGPSADRLRGHRADRAHRRSNATGGWWRRR